jgi:hypothetical protein
MKILARLIRRELRLEANKWGHCAIYESELQRVWPINEGQIGRPRSSNLPKNTDFGWRITNRDCARSLRKRRQVENRVLDYTFILQLIFEI